MRRFVMLLGSVGLAVLLAFGVVVLVSPTKEVRATFPGTPGRIAFSNPGDREPGLDGEIYTIRPNGGGKVQVTRSKYADDIHPSYSPDGERIAFSSDRDGGPSFNNSIYTIKASGGDRRKVVTLNGPDPGYPAYSPDGERIAYVDWTDTFDQVFTVKVGGGASAT